MPRPPPARGRPPLAVLGLVLAVVAAGTIGQAFGLQLPTMELSAETADTADAAPAADAARAAGAATSPSAERRGQLARAARAARADRADRADRGARGEPGPVGTGTLAESPSGGARHDPDQPAVMPHTHTIAAGETLADIAARYGLSVDELAQANALRNRNQLSPGRTLVLPRLDEAVPASPEAAVAADLPVARMLQDTAAGFGLDPALVQAIAWRESGWKQHVVSSQGAIGVMQVRPTTGGIVAEELGQQLNLYDVADNITAGVAYLDRLHTRKGGNVPEMLAAYHQGDQSVRDAGRLPITDRYITEVLALRDRFAAAR